MSIIAKICGLRDEASVKASIEGGANYLGFVFYQRSPRAIDALTVGRLIRDVPPSIVTVGLFVNPSDEELMKVLSVAPLKMIQLHGDESLERVAEIKRLTKLPIIKAVGIGSASDIAKALTYENVADILLLDAKPGEGSLPGGNALSFDWALLSGVSFKRPWMLAGGLNESNLRDAVRAANALLVDVSSGVEDRPGQKNPQKIRAFLQKARNLPTYA